MSEYIINEQEEDDLRSGNGLTLRSVLEMTWALRYWIILSLILCVSFAAVYLYVKPKVYHSYALVMVTNDKNAGMASSSQMSFIADMTGVQSFNSLSNEKVIIKSTPVLQAVVEEQGLNIRYYVRTHFVSRETMAEEVQMKFTPAEGKSPSKLPFYRVEYDVIDTASLSVTIKRLAHRQEVDVCQSQVVRYGEPLPVEDWGYVTFSFRPEACQRFHDGHYDYYTSGRHSIVLYSSHDRARELVSSINVDVMEDQSSRMSSSSILQLVMQDTHPERSEMVLAKVIEKYNELTKTHYMSSNAKTMEFIDNRLADLSGQLSVVEGDIKQFSTRNGMIDIESQAQLSLNTEVSLSQQLQEVEMQLALLEMVNAELQGNPPYTVLPSNVGLTDATIVGFISSYNTACIERARLLAGSSASNPVIVKLDKQIADLRAIVDKSVSTQITSLRLRQKELQRLAGRTRNALSNVPGQKINLAQIEREQSVIEPLYVLLQKKREETMLAIVAEPDIARMVEYPEDNSILVGPNARQVFIFAVVVGFILPLLLLYLFSLLKTKVQNPDDIVSRTRAPLLGVVPRHQGPGFKAADMAVEGSSGSSSVLSEAMRTIRTNLSFLSGKVLQITSSIPGEGKSFVSANVAISLCSIGKRVILVETDLRKGRQRRTFDLPRNHKNGLSNYLSGEVNDWRDAIYPISTFPGLDVMLKGAVPPNPNELLSGERFGKLIEELKEVYDYIILDSPPYLVIADPMTLNKHVDRNIYVVRAGKADLRFVNELDAAIKGDRLSNVSVILNDVEMSNSRAKYSYGYRYGYGYGYGYGYRYGYAYGYGNDSSHPSKASFLSRLVSRFGRKK